VDEEDVAHAAEEEEAEVEKGPCLPEKILTRNSTPISAPDKLENELEQNTAEC
jgi:hypothetical protein